MWAERSGEEPRCFKDIVNKLYASAGESSSSIPKHVLINPILGPEPLCGSTRMKGGSATKIILDAVLLPAVAKVMQIPLFGDRVQKLTAGDDMAWRVISACRRACHAAYTAQQGLAAAIELCGRSLREGGHIYYVAGTGAQYVGFIDASEMRPTFGSSADEVRSFLKNGWTGLGNEEGDQSHLSDLHRITWQDLKELKVTESDTVVALQCSKYDSEIDDVVAEIAEKEFLPHCKALLPHR